MKSVEESSRKKNQTVIETNGDHDEKSLRERDEDLKESQRIDRDITTLKQAEQEMRKSRDLLENLACLVPGVIYQYRLNPDGSSSFPWSSPGMIDIYEVTPEEVQHDASPVFGRLHPEDLDLVSNAIYESAQTLNTFFCEFRVILPRQGLRWRWSQAQPERTEDGGTLWHGIISDITERKMVEEALRISEERHRTIIQTAMDGFWLVDRDGRLMEVNDAYCRMSGYSEKDLLTMHISDLEVLADDHEITAHFERIMALGEERFETRHRRKDGSVFEVEISAQGRLEDGGHFIVFIQDISKRKSEEQEKLKLESQLHQAQKIESVGRLAGGVAHDFNNMLGVILGHVDMLLEQVDPALPIHNDLNEIRKAAERSADLTRHLLAFARKQTVTPKVIDLNLALEGMLQMLRRLIGENISLVWKPNKENVPIYMDLSQINQMLANLCVNARDSITDVGKVTIETGIVTFDEDFCLSHSGFIPGRFVMLAVSDDGCGMDQKTLTQIFEPFFTTKDLGKGTGLGLSTVYGIVKQNEGFINVYSEPGQGTIFKIYLPMHRGKQMQIREKGPDKSDVGGQETILLVEDEPAILRMTTVMLERLGYTVVAANTPGEAIRLAEVHAGKIDLLITDVVMPEMNGRDLAKILLTRYPNLKRLFMSGYTADVIAHHGVLNKGVYFIQKPFSKKDLAFKVKEVLDSLGPDLI